MSFCCCVCCLFLVDCLVIITFILILANFGVGKTLEAAAMDEFKVIDKFIAYIENDADEKVEEIEVKSLEQACIRKVALLHDGRKRVDGLFAQHKQRLVEMSSRLMSGVILRNRIILEEHRTVLLSFILEEAKQTLCKRFLLEDVKFYKILFSKALLQGTCAVLSEKTMHIFIKKSDHNLAKMLIPSVTEEYKKLTGLSPKIKVRRDFYLAEEPDLKLTVTSKKQKVSCRISLMQRLNEYFYEMIPMIRSTLLK